jgi:hypothetical protein
MKKIIILSLLFVVFGCQTKAQRTQPPTIDKQVVEMLKANKLNLQLFELAFVLPELTYLIEKDTTGLFDKRISNAFASNLSIDVKYIHSLSLDFLVSKIKEDDSLIKAFPDATEKIIRKESYIIRKPEKSFSEIYKSYIKYPEQVDDATLIILLTANDCQIYESIASDEVALYNFNNWIEYGFDEFRYYPDSENPISKRINDKLANWVIEKANCSDNVLVIKAKAMLKETMDSY